MLNQVDGLKTGRVEERLLYLPDIRVLLEYERHIISHACVKV